MEGAVDFLRGGLVAYQETVKRAKLGVTASSVFSTEAASQMAVGACSLLRTEVAVATTGVVGGDSVDGVKPGTVFMGTCVDGDVRSIEHRFSGSPEAICDQARRRALLDLLDHVRASGRVDRTVPAVTGGAGAEASKTPSIAVWDGLDGPSGGGREAVDALRVGGLRARVSRAHDESR